MGYCDNKMNRRLIVIICGVALTIATVVGVVSLRNRSRELSMPEVPVAVSTDKVRVKAVERKVETVAKDEAAAASDAVAIVCGEDATTADRYEARNDALRSIAQDKRVGLFCISFTVYARL